jgi:ABC-2 type transport system ATP-binding protein
MITGYIEPTSGTVIIDGINMAKKPQKAKKQIGYMPEGVPLYTDLTVKEFVTYMAEIKKVDRKIRKQKVDEIIRQTGLKEVERKLTKSLSRGYKQRVSMAGALVGDPKILILDEPTVGLDPKQITEIRNLIKELGKTHTIILSSHILSEVSQICNKVIIINQGKIIAVDTPENLERKVAKNNSIYVTVEDPEDKMKTIQEKITDIEKISFIQEDEDKTKQYRIEGKEGVDLRKTLFTELAKENITIFEMKKADTTLEDAFIQLIDEGGNNHVGSN